MNLFKWLLIVVACTTRMSIQCSSCTTEQGTSSSSTIPYVRPPPSARRFNSTYINSLIDTTVKRMKDPALATLFANCFPNTLDTTVMKWSEDDTFVITGDIDAMWLRDSTNQVWPYTRFLEHTGPYTRRHDDKDSAWAADDLHLTRMIRGLVLRQLRSVLIDPYANSFNYNATSPPQGHQSDLRHPQMQPAVFEGKYELDSLCAVLKLATRYVNKTGDTSILTLDEGSGRSLFFDAAGVILEVMEHQTSSTAQQAAVKGNANEQYPYRFFRDNYPWEFDVYPRASPINRTGMVRSAFRPSDDQTEYDFLVPSNIMAEVELTKLIEMLAAFNASIDRRQDVSSWIKRAERVKASIQEGLQSFGLTQEKHVGKGLSSSSSASTAVDSLIFGFETDGFDKYNLMDDANVPSLLSIPFLGFTKYPSETQATRRFVLSAKNPYYYCGALGCGVGSPHTWPGFIWPMALIVRAMTSNNDIEIMEQLEMLKASAQFTGFMHESFDPSNVKNFTRPWFAWANTMFGELIVTLAEEKPHLIFRSS